MSRVALYLNIRLSSNSAVKSQLHLPSVYISAIMTVAITSDECRLNINVAANPQTKPTWVGSPPVGCYCPHSPSPFIIIS